jgi:hypothetical protein
VTVSLKHRAKRDSSHHPQTLQEAPLRDWISVHFVRALQLDLGHAGTREGSEWCAQESCPVVEFSRDALGSKSQCDPDRGHHYCPPRLGELKDTAAALLR